MRVPEEGAPHAGRRHGRRALQQSEGGARRPTAAARAFSEEMRDLTHDIEDCIERFLHHVTCKEGRRGRNGWRTWRQHPAPATSSPPRSRSSGSVRRKRAHGYSARLAPPPPPPRSSAAEPAQPDNPVGIAEAKEKLRKLLLLPAEPSPSLEPAPAQLMVVAVVGFGGSGRPRSRGQSMTVSAKHSFPVLGLPSICWRIAMPIAS